MLKHTELDNTALSEIHNKILQSESISHANMLLGLGQEDLLSIKLRLHFLNDLTLTYELFKKMSTAQAHNIWGNAYYKPFPKVHTKLNHYLLSDIHRVFLDSNSFKTAAGLLGLPSIVLNIHLYKCLIDNDKHLTPEYLKSISVRKALDIWKDQYNQPLNLTHIDISKYPFSIIHAVILDTQNINEMSHLFATHHTKIDDYLKNYRFNSLTFSYNNLKNISANQIYNTWGQAYFKPLPKVYSNINQYPLSEVHNVLLSSNVSAVADLLGASNNDLSTYLTRHILPNGTPLTREYLKELTVQQVQDISNKVYSTPTYGCNEDLYKCPFSKIHSIIRKSFNLNDILAIFSIKYDQFTNHIKRYRLNGVPLTYSILKHKSAVEIYNYWGDLYHEPLPKSCSNIYKYPLSFVHNLIVNSKTSTTTTDLLGISQSELNTYLNKYRLSKNIPLTFDFLKSLTLNEAEDIWGDEYNETDTKPLYLYAFSEIHKKILNSSTENEAAHMLNTTVDDFKTYLGRRQLVPYEPSTYEYLKKLTVEKASEILQKKYNRLLYKSKIVIDKYPFSTIHREIAKSRSLSEAASFLGVSSVQLGIYLGRCAPANQPIYFKYLKSLSVEDAKTLWGSNYNKRMIAKRIDINYFSFSKVHQVILDTNSPIEAINALGISGKPINSYLIKFYVDNAPLKYTRLKTMSVASARRKFNNMYDCSLAEVILSQYPLAHIHKAILDTNNVTDAANLLKVSNPGSINNHLRNIYFESKPLTYERLRNLSIKYVQTKMLRKDNQNSTECSLTSDEPVTDMDLLPIDEDYIDSIWKCLLPDKDENNLQESVLHSNKVISQDESVHEYKSTTNESTVGLDSEDLISFMQDFPSDDEEQEQHFDAEFEFCDDCFSMDTSGYEAGANIDFTKKRTYDDISKQAESGNANENECNSYEQQRFFKKHSTYSKNNLDSLQQEHLINSNYKR